MLLQPKLIKPWYCVCLKVQLNNAHLTTASIFFLYLRSILLRYSGLINIAAKLKAEFFSPALWHSITTEVKICTTSVTERNNYAKYLFTNINIESLWANAATKVLMKTDSIFLPHGIQLHNLCNSCNYIKKIVASPLFTLWSSAQQQACFDDNHFSQIWSAPFKVYTLAYFFHVPKKYFQKKTDWNFVMKSQNQSVGYIWSWYPVCVFGLGSSKQQLWWARTDETACEETILGALCQRAVLGRMAEHTLHLCCCVPHKITRGECPFQCSG